MQMKKPLPQSAHFVLLNSPKSNLAGNGVFRHEMSSHYWLPTSSTLKCRSNIQEALHFASLSRPVAAVVAAAADRYARAGRRGERLGLGRHPVPEPVE